MAERLNAPVLKTDFAIPASARKQTITSCQPIACSRFRSHLISLNFTVFDGFVVTKK
jgi:hypothetical protein